MMGLLNSSSCSTRTVSRRPSLASIGCYPSGICLRTKEQLLRRERIGIGEAEEVVVEDGGQFVRDLRFKVRAVHLAGKEQLTWKKISWCSSSSSTARMPRKLSSLVGSLPFASSTLGVMTVARLARSILLPVSSSMCEKEATHLRKTKITSMVSRCALGSRQETRCSMRSRAAVSSIPAKGQLDVKIGGEGRRTLSCHEEVMKLVREQGVGQLAQKLLEQRRKLDRIFVYEADAARIAVESVTEVLKPADVAIFPENAFDRHV